jgi:hypothetical protein
VNNFFALLPASFRLIPEINALLAAIALLSDLATLVVLGYSFFCLPWYTVLICALSEGTFLAMNLLTLMCSHAASPSHSSSIFSRMTKAASRFAAPSLSEENQSQRSNALGSGHGPPALATQPEG